MDFRHFHALGETSREIENADQCLWGDMKVAKIL
jgi:hypothetical protein